MEKMKVHNLIIGFGKAGKTLAGSLARHGQEVVLVEKDETMYGGTCINIGCIPSKKLLVEGEYGLRNLDKEEVFRHAMTQKDNLIAKLRAANFNKLASLENVTIIDGTASFIDEHNVRVVGKAGEMVIEAQRFVEGESSTTVVTSKGDFEADTDEILGVTLFGAGSRSSSIFSRWQSTITLRLLMCAT